MSKTSAKYILQIKSEVFLRLNLIYTNIVGCIINHVKKKCWWLQETAVGQSLSFCLSCHRPIYWEILNQQHYCTIAPIYIYLNQLFCITKYPFSGLTNRNNRLGGQTSGKIFQLVILSPSVYLQWEWELQSLQNHNFHWMGDQTFTDLPQTYKSCSADILKEYEVAVSIQVQGRQTWTTELSHEWVKQLSPSKNKDHHTVKTRSDALHFPAIEQFLTTFFAFNLHPCPICLTYPPYICVFLL